MKLLYSVQTGMATSLTSMLCVYIISKFSVDPSITPGIWDTITITAGIISFLVGTGTYYKEKA